MNKVINAECEIKHINKFWTGGKKIFFFTILNFVIYFKWVRVEQLQTIEIK